MTGGVLVFKEVEDLDDDELEDDGSSSHTHAAAEDMKCPKCKKDVNKTELVHPVMLTFNSESNLILFFHDPCYKDCSSAEVDRLVRDAKYEMLLLSAEDGELYDC